jgi:hypothetical protein
MRVVSDRLDWERGARESERRMEQCRESRDRLRERNKQNSRDF